MHKDRLESEAFDQCLMIDESNHDSKIYAESKPVKIILVKIKWNEENGNLTVPSRKKQKNLIKELSWMNSVQTGKHVLKEYPALVYFGLKCLHSKHPGVKISRVPLICFCTTPHLAFDTPATLGSFSLERTSKLSLTFEHSGNLFSLPGALFSSWLLPPLLRADAEISPL